jgi:hypothetical protein
MKGSDADQLAPVISTEVKRTPEQIGFIHTCFKRLIRPENAVPDLIRIFRVYWFDFNHMIPPSVADQMRAIDFQHAVMLFHYI